MNQSTAIFYRINDKHSLFESEIFEKKTYTFQKQKNKTNEFIYLVKTCYNIVGEGLKYILLFLIKHELYLSFGHAFIEIFFGFELELTKKTTTITTKALTFNKSFSSNIFNLSYTTGNFSLYVCTDCTQSHL